MKKAEVPYVIYNKDLQNIYDTVELNNLNLLDTLSDFTIMYGTYQSNYYYYYIKVKTKVILYKSLFDLKEVYLSGNTDNYFIIEESYKNIITTNDLLDNVFYKDIYDNRILNYTNNKTEEYINGVLLPPIHEFEMIYKDVEYNNIRELLNQYITIPENINVNNLCSIANVRSDGDSKMQIGNVSGINIGNTVIYEKTNHHLRLQGSFSTIRKDNSGVCLNTDCSYYGFQPIFILGRGSGEDELSLPIPKKTLALKNASNASEVGSKNMINSNTSNYEILWLGEDITTHIDDNGDLKLGYFEFNIETYGLYKHGTLESNPSAEQIAHSERFSFYNYSDGNIDYSDPKYFPGQFILWSGITYNRYNNTTFSINHKFSDLSLFGSTQPVPSFTSILTVTTTPTLRNIYASVYGYNSTDSESIRTRDDMDVGFVRAYVYSKEPQLFVTYRWHKLSDDTYSKFQQMRFDGLDTHYYEPITALEDPDLTQDPGYKFTLAEDSEGYTLFRDEGNDIYSFKVPTRINSSHDEHGIIHWSNEFGSDYAIEINFKILTETSVSNVTDNLVYKVNNNNNNIESVDKLAGPYRRIISGSDTNHPIWTSKCRMKGDFISRIVLDIEDIGTNSRNMFQYDHIYTNSYLNIDSLELSDVPTNTLTVSRVHNNTTTISSTSDSLPYIYKLTNLDNEYRDYDYSYQINGAKKITEYFTSDYPKPTYLGTNSINLITEGHANYTTEPQVVINLVCTTYYNGFSPESCTATKSSSYREGKINLGYKNRSNAISTTKGITMQSIPGESFTHTNISSGELRIGLNSTNVVDGKCTGTTKTAYPFKIQNYRGITYSQPYSIRGTIVEIKVCDWNELTCEKEHGNIVETPCGERPRAY